MSLLNTLEIFDPGRLIINRPTANEISKVSKRIERQAEGLDEKNIQPSKDVLQEVIECIRSGKELNRKNLKLMSAGGIDFFQSLPDCDSLLDKFLLEIRRVGSALVFKSLLIGYLRLSHDDYPLIAARVRKFLNKNIDYLPERWLKKVNQYDLLGEKVGQLLASKLLNDDEREPLEILEDSGIKRGLLISGGFSYQVFKVVAHQISKEHNLANLTRFFDLLGEGEAEPELPFAHAQSGDIGLITMALLNPYLSEMPDAGVKDRVENFLLERFGDPRVKAQRWSKVDDKYKGVLSRWLTQQSFELLMKVLSNSNDTQQWADRSKFWGYYIDNHFVTDAWVAFGPDAYYQATALVNNGTIKSRGAFARLEKANIQPIHSVIFMKIGDLVISEWTHDGKVRIYKSGNSHSPRFYLGKYHPDDIRSDYHPDYKKSHLGYWQFDIAQYINRLTGIRGPYGGGVQHQARPQQQATIGPGQAACSSCGVVTQQRWLTPQGKCLACVGNNVRRR